MRVAQARLVDDLLDVSRIVAGKLQLKIALVDLTQEARGRDRCGPLAADAKNMVIDLHVDYSPGLP